MKFKIVIFILVLIAFSLFEDKTILAESVQDALSRIENEIESLKMQLSQIKTIKGNKGDKGPQGPRGIDGKDGKDGERGPRGYSGKVPDSWGHCVWKKVGAIESHGDRGNWCPDGYFITQFDLEGDKKYSAHDTPYVGRVKCCKLGQ